MTQTWGLAHAFQYVGIAAADENPVSEAQGFRETTTFAGLIRRSCNW